MASSSDTVSMALFCDFENVALGVRDAKYEKFDIKLVLERLLLKGSIVVKKAYCDWDRYKGFKATMHEANFELIEIPHVRQSGKNSADIRLVVDALDLCYTKSHVNTFVIISGDSDFSPLVSKLRENAKQVIGVGVQRSTSDLLTANCDEFIFYDDLVRESQRAAAKREAARAPQPAAKRAPDGDKQRREDLDARKTKAIEIAVQTFDALATDRGDSGKIWASVLKNAIKRRKPDFNETYYGFRAFGNLLDEAQARGLLEVGRDEKSGTYVYRHALMAPAGEAVVETASEVTSEAAHEAASKAATGRGRGGRRHARESTGASASAPATAADGGERESQTAVEGWREVTDASAQTSPEAEAETGERSGAFATQTAADHADTRATRRPARKSAAKKASKTKQASAESAAGNTARASEESASRADSPQASPEPDASATAAHESASPSGKTARKSASRGRRPRKSTAATDAG
ncbi:NYN domain-containing protein [Paraburkholderia solisilvae]|uniref:HTH OST-type domain-containing protein n=1 Tax=Paraburkholderia solisilvae TaxID=624376 RepID=A0A6J5EJ23_9BURK|nr:NYN domain-containing protein [Paraburkholderia solisilvae]CAB3765727.1 hypothetical protein LMG29739_04643 [Paraburkholderia solisilvae]